MQKFTVPLNWPFSSSLAQNIQPVTSWWSPSGGQFGLVNISLGQSNKPELEAEILDRAAGYGRQLGILMDAVAVMARRLDVDRLERAERQAMIALGELSLQIAAIKALHGAAAVKLDPEPFYLPPAPRNLVRD